MNPRCNKCGWIHFAVSMKFAIAETAKFNDYFWGLSEEKRHDYYGNRPAKLEQYTRCFRCGNDYKDFRLATNAELERIRGSTIQPIVIFDEALEKFCR